MKIQNQVITGAPWNLHENKRKCLNNVKTHWVFPGNFAIIQSSYALEHLWTFEF